MLEKGRVRFLSSPPFKIDLINAKNISNFGKVSQKRTISAIENNRIALGVERAKVIAKALKCHPAVLVFPGWELEEELAA